MSEQNIYDNQEFFNGYYALRQRNDCYNEILEQPAISRFIPDLKNKTVLDLGCGYGQNCIDFIKRGAKKVIGVDISKKMLDVAREKSNDSKIEYINMSMTEINSLNETFDLIYSSLAFHYIEDFNRLIGNCANLLNKGGYLLYSQEHPIATATIGGDGHYNRNEQGEKISYTFSNYSQGGKRETYWYVDGVIKFHRTIGEILTTIAKSGFIIEEVNEPIPEEWAIKRLPSIAKELIKPSFLIIKARKG